MVTVVFVVWFAGVGVIARIRDHCEHSEHKTKADRVWEGGLCLVSSL